MNARAAEAAFAAGRPVRAAAYLDAAIASTDGRRDRVRLGLIYDRLAQFRRVAGDAEGSLAARRRAVDLVPTTPSSARAAVVAGLAQMLMLEGTFSEADRLARRDPDRQGVRSPGAPLGAARHDDTRSLSRLARRPGGGPGDVDRRSGDGRGARRPRRAFPHPCQPRHVVLELAGRHEEAVKVASAGIEAAKAAGLEAVYGNVLRGNAADSLFLLGRWEEARAMSMTALEWLPAGINFLNALVSLATVEIELSAGEAAGRSSARRSSSSRLSGMLSRPCRCTSPPPRSRVAGDLDDARRAADRG